MEPFQRKKFSYGMDSHRGNSRPTIGPTSENDVTVYLPEGHQVSDRMGRYQLGAEALASAVTQSLPEFSEGFGAF